MWSAAYAAWLPRDGFARLLLAAVAVRLLLLPVAHWWDGQTWVNTFAELAQAGDPLEAIRRPYETMRELSLLLQASTRGAEHYEHWAYPPLMLYVYWPLAHAYTALGGTLQPTFYVQPTFFLPQIPLVLQALIRLPNIAADVATLALLRDLGVGRAGLRWYAFNPLVLLIGAWTFEPVVVMFLLLALRLAERGRWVTGAASLALGATAKFVPLVALPALLLAILRAPGTTRGHMRTLVLATGAAAVTFGVLVWPVLDGVAYAVRFHAARFGGGLTAMEIGWGTAALSFPYQGDWQAAWPVYATVLVGELTLPLALLLAGLLLTWRTLPLSTGFLVLVLAFLAGSKLVNEAYALPALALTTVELARRPSEALRTCRMLLWVLPASFVFLRTPWWAFLSPGLAQLAPTVWADPLALWAEAARRLPNPPELAVVQAVLGTLFTVVTIVAAWASSRSATSTETPDALPHRLHAAPGV